ncbi:hypothetical protein [Myxococcus qinghaiensis]|uniref:hypothetical protein n=1 Tax=Myxococcus qinghaiensis TaxID=2906758 RepID=UPI0020A7E202|nr:hypothetical protein [Myxococcus qinghaiensis]MCP3168980.1 hypothetical protein [Myxococcus qinghaiensis]
MALSPDEYARRDASHALHAKLHVQLEVDRVKLPPFTPGEAVVEGRIARIFRGNPAQLSTPVSFEVPCYREGDMLPPSGIRWKLVEYLEHARYIEIYLDTNAVGFMDAGPGITVIEALSDTPQFVFSDIEEEDE